MLRHRDTREVEHVIRTVAEFYDVEISDICGRSRIDDLVVPRQMCMLIARRRGAPLQQIAICLKRDTSTVVYGVGAMEDRIFQDEYLRSDFERITAKLGIDIRITDSPNGGRYVGNA